LPPLTPNLRELLDDASSSKLPLILPGAYDALSARLAQVAKFPAVYVTGAGLANAHFGIPDIGLVDLSQLCGHVTAIAEVVDLPLVVDADTGFGNAVAVTRTVRLLERAGAAAIQIEDQISPKRCGHFAGKDVIPVHEMLGKIRAALDSRESENTLIIARTDAVSTEGLDRAIDRGQLFSEAGADAVFIEAPESRDALQAIGERVAGPLVANMVEGGLTPLLSREDLGTLGFQIVLYANSALRAAQLAVTEIYEVLAEFGTTAGALNKMVSWNERQAAVAKSSYDEVERKYS
jgi:2-methylisocitrate lyase-like PEP mutase family enzyme